MLNATRTDESTNFGLAIYPLVWASIQAWVHTKNDPDHSKLREAMTDAGFDYDILPEVARFFIQQVEDRRGGDVLPDEWSSLRYFIDLAP